MRTKYLESLLAWIGADASLLAQPGVSVIGHADRAEHKVTAAYQMNEHLVVSCDPAAASMLVEATSELAPTLTAWQQLTASLGGELLGAGRSQLLNNDLPTVDALPDRFSLVTLDATQPDDLALITQLVERSDEDDLDEAEIELDNLDDIITVILDDNGEIATFSSARPFDMAEDFGDIGILTRPECRGKGLGSIAVAALCPRLRAAGLEPLYRCDEDNTGSVKLSQSLGFQIATQVVGSRFEQTIA